MHESSCSQENRYAIRQELETLGEVLLNPWIPPVKLLQNAGHSERSRRISPNKAEAVRGHKRSSLFSAIFEEILRSQASSK
jgi:hypothetical protein